MYKLVFAGFVLFFTLLIMLLGSLGDAKLHVFFLDVGQGDSILIQTPNMQFILIDGGPDNSVLEKIGGIIPFYDRSIDLVILTHPHADHVSGLVDVLRNYDVKEIMITGVNFHNSVYDEFLRLIELYDIPIVYADAMYDYELGSVYIDILWPFLNVKDDVFDNLNDSSITFRVFYHDFDVYLSGDLEIDGAKKLVDAGLDLSADVMKASHHASRTGILDSLLKKINAVDVVISCGVDNKYGHPHVEALDAFDKFNMKTFRTDVDGSVEVVSNGIKDDFFIQKELN